MSIVCLDCTAKHILRKIVHIRALLLISRTIQFVCFYKKYGRAIRRFQVTTE